jgi:pimeloyl-ACP methyl ester carboxylesterase
MLRHLERKPCRNFTMNWTATTLVMLPGLDGTGELFEPALQLDWGGLRAVAVPLPTNGPQDYESLAQRLAPALPDGDLVLLAESFSTPLAMRLASQLGDRVKAVVLIAGFCASPQASSLGWLPLRPLFAVSPPAFFLKQFLTGESPPAALLSALTRVIGRVPGAILAERVRVVLALREADCPDLGQRPLLLLQAQQDRVIPWAAQSQLERHFPEATCVWLNGPHLLLQTRTQECRNAVIRFLTGLG